MERLEKLIQEYKIRFHDTDLIDPEEDHFETLGAPNRGRYNPEVSTEVMWNRNGIVWTAEKGWATALLTEKPDKWVVEKDESHPMWEKFKEWYKSIATITLDYDTIFYGVSENGEWGCSEELLFFKGCQYLTLDQWARFFLDEPKVGGLCLFFDISTGKASYISKLIGITEHGTYESEYSYMSSCIKVSPEFEEAYRKELERIKNL